jgi:LemA protein
MGIPLVVLSVAAAGLLWLAVAVIRVFNALISARNGCHNARSAIDVQLRKRHDLVPSVVAAVRGYASHEHEVLSAVTAARAAALEQFGAVASAAAEQTLGGALSHLLARVEAYPDLKASANFLHLQRTLTEVEEQISAARRAFNAQVLLLNNLVEQFPTLVVARLTGFDALPFFASEDERAVARRVPDQHAHG